ncbi:MAG: tetrahydromethanopterin S-methyltransferase subunit H [Candidatus Thorarchaeota archaeon]
MFMFEKEQIIHNIGGVRVGGNLGETPTVLAGTIFYSGHKIVKDPVKGLFDKDIAEKMIIEQDIMSSTTGNPCMIQIFAESNEAIEKYIDFAVDCSKAPIIIDSTSPDVRIHGLTHAEEIGVADRAVYNSINISVTSKEIEFLEEMQHSSAIILAFNPQDPSIAGRKKVMDDGALELTTGLLPLSKRLGITQPLIDTATTAMGAGAGSSVAFTFVSKTVYGLPTGSGIHNAPSSWPWLNEYKQTNKDAFKACDISSNIAVHLLGADFILYGPIKNAKTVFPVIAMADVFEAEYANLEFGSESPKDHPFRKLV